MPNIDVYICIQSSQELPIPRGNHLTKFNSALERIASQHPRLKKSELVCYAWHGTKGKFARDIVKDGFDIKLAGKSNGELIDYSCLNHPSLNHPLALHFAPRLKATIMTKVFHLHEPIPNPTHIISEIGTIDPPRWMLSPVPQMPCTQSNRYIESKFISMLLMTVKPPS